MYKRNEEGEEQEYAIKIMDESSGAQFERERMAFERLKGHQFIVRTFALFRDPATLRFCIVMPYIRFNLQEILNNRCQTPPGKWEFETIRQIINGVAGIHAKRIIHRDLKTTNILITEHNVIKITDFGTATDYHKGQVLKQDAGHHYSGLRK